MNETVNEKAAVRPLFSIITVTRNASQQLGATLASVAAQSCRLYEHLIVDGASTDGTLELVRRMATERTRLHSEPDRGIYDAMNKGLAMAAGDYLIMLNAGDRFHSPDTLQQLADVILDQDYPGVVYGQTDIVDAQGNYVGPRHLQAPQILTLSSFKNGMVVCHQAFTVLRKLAPNYDTRWRFSADYEWCIRCLQHSKRNVYTGITTIDYLAEGMTTRNRRRSLIERARIMARYYGWAPTLARHLKFALRFARNKAANRPH